MLRHRWLLLFSAVVAILIAVTSWLSYPATSIETWLRDSPAYIPDQSHGGSDWIGIRPRGVTKLDPWIHAGTEIPNVKERLEAMLQSRDLELATRAAVALQYFGDRGSINALLSALQSERAELRQSVIPAVGNIDDPRTISALRDTAANDDVPMIREVARRQLQMMGHLDVGPATLPLR